MLFSDHLIRKFSAILHRLVINFSHLCKSTRYCFFKSKSKVKFCQTGYLTAANQKFRIEAPSRDNQKMFHSNLFYFKNYEVKIPVSSKINIKIIKKLIINIWIITLSCWNSMNIEFYFDVKFLQTKIVITN